MQRESSPNASPGSKPRLPVTRLISTDLDLKKSGLVTGNASPRPRPTLPGQPSQTGSRRSPDYRRAEVQRRLREQEESRRAHYQQMLRQDEERLGQLDRRREELKRLIKTRAQQKEAEAKTKRLNAIKVAQDKFEDMLDKLRAKETRRLQVLDKAQTEMKRKEQDRDAAALEAVVQDLEHRRKTSRGAEKAAAAARQKRKKDAQLRQRAAEALWDRQRRILDALRDSNRAELERILSMPQPHLAARMPRYNFMEYPANRSMRRLLHEYKRKHIDEVTFNTQAAALARKMSPRRILLHQNQLLRDQQALDLAAEGGGGAGPIQVSARPTAERTRLRWHEPSPEQDAARHLAEALADEALQRAGNLYQSLLERSDVDLLALLDGDAAQTFDDEGDLEAGLSAFDFGDEFEMDVAAVGRIEAMYRSQACRQRSERETRAYPSGELDTFSSAVLDPGVSCSCTTLSGVDSQCSLCQLAVAAAAEKGERS